MSIKSFLEARYFKDLAFIDFRALIAFRVFIGTLFLCDLLLKSCNLTAFYTDLGIYPISLGQLEPRWWAFSFHNFDGSFFYQAFLMGVGIVLSISFIIGMRPRLISLLLWIFIVSLHNKNPLILHAGDGLLRVLLFWWTLLMVVGFRPRLSMGVSNLPSFALLFQVLVMYFFTAILKNDPVWREDFLALYYALNLDQFTTPIGRWLLQFPRLLKFLSATTYYMEMLGPIIYFYPSHRQLIRWILPLCFMGFHLGLILTMNLGLFPWVCIAAWTLFLPKEFWNACENFLGVWGKYLKNNISVPPMSGPFELFGKALSIWCLATILIWNIYTLPSFGKTPDLFRFTALPLRLDQYWSMFAPKPMTVDGWLLVDGKLRDGTAYDPWVKSEKVAWLRPSNIYEHFRSSSPWRKYISNVFINGKGDEYSRAFGKYLCREYNRLQEPRPVSEKQLISFEISYLTEITPAPGQEPSIDQRLLWTHRCFKF